MSESEERGIWWHARADDAVIEDVRRRLQVGGFAFLDRFSTRDMILAEWGDRSENMAAANSDGHHLGGAR